MARRIPEHRFDQLLRAATDVFIERGYRRTQMADVAEAIGVAKGTLYGYVDGKEALFAACLQHADDRDPVALPKVLPLPTPPPGALARQVEAALAAGSGQPRLEQALAAPPNGSDRKGARARVEAELREVVGELFDLMHASRRGVKLLDRCLDHPELAGLWQTRGREQVRHRMRAYLASRIEAGLLRPVEDLRLSARIVIEVCTTWAVHIHWDRAPEPFEPEAMRAQAIEFVVRALTP